jgi:hypothetical protein
MLGAMHTAGLVVALAVGLLSAVELRAQAPAPARRATPAVRAVGTTSDLMVLVLRPASDAVFYISSRTPATEAEWGALQAQTLMLAESANLLMLPDRARGRAQWLADATLLLEAGRAAFVAAKAKDVSALEALNDRMYEACVVCHQHFRPGYGKRP